MNNWNGYCHRCGAASISHIMSMYSTELICRKCKREEKERPDYNQAVAQDLDDHAALMAGIGCPPEQVADVRKSAKKIRGS